MRRVEPSPARDERPEVPGFRTWRGIYILVLVWFALCIVGFVIFSRVFA